MSDEGGPIQILLVEDNPGDVRLTQEALRDARLSNDLHFVGDGEAAMAFLRNEGSYADSPRPDLVLLDLNLPRKSGGEVLAEIKADPDLRRLPVVVLTTSAAERDILHAYDHHVNAYVTKPVDFADFMEAVRSVEDFWLTVVRLPPEG